MICGSFSAAALAQTAPVPQSSPSPQAPAQPVQTAPAITSGDLLRARISKAKAFIAVRNYSAATYELENVRRESGDPAILSGVNVLLMNSYLEQGDYKRAQDLLKEFYAEQKTTKAGAKANYLAVAGQIVKGARNRLERYQTLGLSVTDRTLPLEAVNDLEKMRETLELVIAQSKEMSADQSKAADAMALLEEATNSRSMLARDEYDSRRWRDEVADAREDIANSRTVVISAISGVPSTNVADGRAVTEKPAVQAAPAAAPSSAVAFEPVRSNPTPSVNTDRPRQVEGPVARAGAEPVEKPAETREKTPPAAEKQPEKVAGNDKQPEKTAPAPTETPVETGPITVGSLTEYATNKATPIYPSFARTAHAVGVVRVEVIVDESGEVASIEKTSGPSLLQGAAKDAIRKWRFKPFERNGQPVKAIGFVNFNFSL
ncbi:MAG: TonB family protein [Pyrinomonadaceae bacterium]